MHCGVPTASFAPFRASEAPPVYQPCPPSRSVPQKPLPCTNRVPPSLSVPQKPLPCTNRVPPSRSVPQKPLPCTNSAPPSRSVPQVPLLCTNRAPPSHSVPQVPLLCTNRAPPSRSVPQKPLPCTNRVPPSRSVPRNPFPCTNRVPHLVLCRESTLFEPNSAHNIRRMAVICFCLRLRETMSPLRTVSSQACDGSARWMNGSRSGVFVPDPTSEPCLNLSRHLARSRTLQSWLPV